MSKGRVTAWLIQNSRTPISLAEPRRFLALLLSVFVDFLDRSTSTLFTVFTAAAAQLLARERERAEKMPVGVGVSGSGGAGAARLAGRRERNEEVGVMNLYFGTEDKEISSSS